MAKAKQATATADGEIEVRRLNTLDVFRLARIINKCSAETKRTLLEAVVTDPKGPDEEDGEDKEEAQSNEVILGFNPTKLFFGVAAMLDEAEEPMVKFIASLADMQPKDLNAAPPETTIQILVSVFHQEQEHLTGFFGSVAGVMSETSGESST